MIFEQLWTTNGDVGTVKNNFLISCHHSLQSATCTASAWWTRRRWWRRRSDGSKFLLSTSASRVQTGKSGRKLTHNLFWVRPVDLQAPQNHIPRQPKRMNGSWIITVLPVSSEVLHPCFCTHISCSYNYRNIHFSVSRCSHVQESDAAWCPDYEWISHFSLCSLYFPGVLCTDMWLRLPLCKPYLDRGQALVLAGWFSHKTFSTHTHTRSQGFTACYSWCSWKLERCSVWGWLAGWLADPGLSPLVCFQPKSRWPAAAALSVSFCLFCSSAQVCP